MGILGPKFVHVLILPLETPNEALINIFLSIFEPIIVRQHWYSGLLWLGIFQLLQTRGGSRPKSEGGQGLYQGRGRGGRRGGRSYFYVVLRDRKLSFVTDFKSNFTNTHSIIMFDILIAKTNDLPLFKSRHTNTFCMFKRASCIQFLSHVVNNS